MKLSFSYSDGAFTRAQLLAEQKIERAATGAIREAADLALQAGRKSIAAAGFQTKKFASSLHAKVYPESGTSLRPFARIYSKIPYAGVFETGETIAGKPLLWLPLENTPIGDGGKRMTPAQFVAKIGPLYSVHLKSGIPILATVVRETDARARKTPSWSLIKRGRNPSGRGTVRYLPMYHGVSSVTDPKKFDVEAAVKSVANQLPELFAQYLEADRG
jgi:hypothetical protein